MDLERQFEHAVAHPSARKRFISQVGLGEYAEYVSRVKLRSNGWFNQYKDSIMLCALQRFRKKPTIFVFPGAFNPEYHQTFADFISTFQHHEGYHARETVEDYNGGFPRKRGLISEEYWEFFDELSEIRAIKNQIAHLNSDNSGDYVALVWKNLSFHRNNLETLGVSDYDWKYGNPLE